MAQTSTITTANAIESFYTPGWREGVFRNDATLATLRALGLVEEMAPGGTGYSWHLNTSANTSTAIYTEGSPAPQAVAQGWVRATLSWTYYWAMIQLSGHAMDAVRNGIFDAIEAEMSLAQRDIIDLRSTTMLGSSNNGLQQAISASATYAGITRGSAAYFESSTLSTATIAGLRALHRTVRDAEKGGRPTAHLVSPTVANWYAGLAGVPGTSNFVLQQSGTGPANVDVGYNWTGLTFMGRPVIEVPDLTSTVWLMVDTSAGNFKHKVVRELGVKFHHNEGDSETYLVTTGSTLAVEMPKWQGIMTSVS